MSGKERTSPITGRSGFTDEELLAERRRLLAYARGLTRDAQAAADLLQTVLVRAVRKRHLFNKEHPNSLFSWLGTIMHHEHVNHVRRQQRAALSLADGGDALDQALRLADPKQNPEARVLMRDLERAIKRLPVEQQQVLILIGAEGLSYEDAAEVLCVPVGTVRSRLSRARTVLRRDMDGL